MVFELCRSLPQSLAAKQFDLFDLICLILILDLDSGPPFLDLLHQGGR
jgi:hypothetical protein